MTDKTNLKEMTEYLFNCNFFSDDFDPEGNETHLQCAEELLSSWSFNDVFKEWNKFLREKCHTPESVINFCNLFSYYGGQDYYISNAYDFVGYIYYMVDIEKYWDECGDFLDGLCISILAKSGDISLSKNPCYQSWTDPKVLARVEKYRLRNNKDSKD